MSRYSPVAVFGLRSAGPSRLAGDHEPPHVVEMRTIAQCRAEGLRIYVGCRCGAARWMAARDLPAELDGYTVEALQRRRAWPCQACGGSPALMIYGHAGSTLETELERWADDAPGWIRRR